MSGRNSKLRLLAAMSFTGISLMLGMLGNLLPIHEYDWSDDPNMRELASPNAVLTVTVLCVMGLLVVLAAFVVTLRLEERRGLRRGLLGAIVLGLFMCVYRLFEVLPLYSG